MPTACESLQQKCAFKNECIQNKVKISDKALILGLLLHLPGVAAVQCKLSALSLA